jgi:hypothetical protein
MAYMLRGEGPAALLRPAQLRIADEMLPRIVLLPQRKKERERGEESNEGLAKGG